MTKFLEQWKADSDVLRKRLDERELKSIRYAYQYAIPQDLVAMARAAEKDERLSDGALYGKLADEIQRLRAMLYMALPQVSKDVWTDDNLREHVGPMPVMAALAENE